MVIKKKAFNFSKANTSKNILIRHFITYSILFLIGFQSCYLGFAISYFKLNQDYIATTLCEEKDIPQSCCRGKCQLNKMVQIESTPNSNTETKQLSLLEEISVPTLFFQLNTSPSLHAKKAKKSHLSTTKNSSPTDFLVYSNDYIDRLLRPPCLA